MFPLIMFRKSGTKHSIRGRFGELGEVFKKVFFDFKLKIKGKPCAAATPASRGAYRRAP